MKAEELVAGQTRGIELPVATRRWAWLSRFFEKEMNMSKADTSLTLVIHPDKTCSPELPKLIERRDSSSDVLTFTSLHRRRRDEFDNLKAGIELDTSDEEQTQEEQGNEGQGAVAPFRRAERIDLHRRHEGFHNNMLGQLLAKYADLKLHIKRSEELAFIDFLIFLYKPECSKDYEEYRLLDILKMAFRWRAFQACARSLMNHHPEKDPLSKYLELAEKLPPGIKKCMEPLAKNFILNRFKDIPSAHDELIEQPLSVMQLVLSSDDVRVPSEDVMYDLAIEWAKHKYPLDAEVGARQFELDVELFRLIRFFHLSLEKLVEVAESQDFSHDRIREAVTNAWFFKTRVPYLLVDRSRRERIYDVPVEAKVCGPPYEFCSITVCLTDDEYNRMSLHEGEKIRTQPVTFVSRTMGLELSCVKADVASSWQANKRMGCQELFIVALWATEGSEFPFMFKFEFAARPADKNEAFEVLEDGSCRFESGDSQFIEMLPRRYSALRLDLYLVRKGKVRSDLFL